MQQGCGVEEWRSQEGLTSEERERRHEERAQKKTKEESLAELFSSVKETKTLRPAPTKGRIYLVAVKVVRIA
ncbi:hypothetical protein D918_01107 [Trichuris suis]|nr:hypothetical protein D918_01107 [Trichuris suis]